MATITTDTYLDGGTARTAGETWTCNGGRLTIRTDSRWHANAPASMTGSLGALTISATLGGGYTIDGTAVRWLAYNTGTGTVPAIGTTITGGTSGANGYLLGVYSALTAAPTAVGAAMPASGFIKLREADAAYNASETLTGIGATTTAVDVTGWIEVVHDQSIAITVPRLGSFIVNGDWFYLDNTTGSANQSLQIPTNGGGTGTHVPGVWIEDCVLVGAFLDDGGVFTDYTPEANQDTTNDVNLLPATPAVNDAFYFGFDRATFNKLQINLSTSGVGTWTVVWEYWDGSAWTSLSATDNTTGFTAATGWRTVTWTTPGTWPLYTVNNRSAYWVRARVSAYTSVTTQPKALKAGVNGTNVYTFYPGLVASIMSTTNLGVDPRSRFVCTSGSGVAIIGHNGTSAVGYVPVPGCKTRVPNVFLRQCTTGARASNAAPSGTLGTRPDFTTTGAGVIDMNYTLCDWYLLFAQPFSVTMNHIATFDTVNISECASALDLADGGTGMHGSLDVYSMNLTSNFAGGTITDWYGQRGNAPGTNDHDLYMAYCIGQTLTRCYGGIIGYARSTGYAIYVTQCQNITLDDCYVANMGVYLNTCKNVSIDGLDYCDRYVGTTNTTGTLYALNIYNSCDIVTVRDVTFGLKRTIVNVHPYGGIATVSICSNIKVRECGTRALMLNGGSANSPAYIINDAGNNFNCTFQRLYMQPTRTGAIVTLNSSKGIIYEHVYGDVADTLTVASLNTTLKNCGGTNTTTGQTSVYGTLFWDAFTSDTAGRVICQMDEATTETSAYITTVAGTPKFTSAGGLVLAAVSDEIILEQHYFVKGCTGLPNTAPIVTGTNVTYVSGPDWGNHDIYFQIDVNDGAGWNGTWLDLTGTNLNSFDANIDPDLGFKLKLRIVCDTANTTNLISYIRISTTSTLSAQTTNLYPLDTVSVEITNLTEGTQGLVIGSGGIEDGQVIVSEYANSNGKVVGTFSGITPQNVIVRARNSGIINAAIMEDNGTGYIDYTNEARDFTGSNDVNLLPASIATNDAFYFGGLAKFGKIRIKISTAGTTYTLAWEYYNGTWTSLTVTDPSNSFKNSTGLYDISFTKPSDWATTSVNSQGPYYYVRARVTSGGGTQPKAEHINLYKTIKYLPYTINATITESGLSVPATWQEDSNVDI